MDIKNIISLAKHAKGVDAYYESFRLLQSDLDFFKMYLTRERKSNEFWFKVVPVGFGTVKVFDDIMKAYGLSDNYLEEEYAIYILLKDIILDIYNNPEERQYPNPVVCEFAVWLQKELGLSITHFVSDFINCSRGCAGTVSELSEIIDREGGNSDNNQLR